MTLDPGRLRAMASRLIAANGQASTTFWVPTTAGTYDPDTGITSGEVVEETIVTTTDGNPSPCLAITGRMRRPTNGVNGTWANR